MHEVATQVVTSGLLVRLSGKPSQSLVVNIETQGVSTSEEDIDPQVEFEPIDE